MRTTSNPPPQEPSGMPYQKYLPFWQGNAWAFPERTWPDCHVTRAPRWLSTDLRDGNQALVNPLDLGQKAELFALLVELGFKEIEVGFPAASQTDYDFVRFLAQNSLVPADVCVSVLTQARGELISRTLESLRGFERATVHLYNATSPEFRRVVFGKTRGETVQMAVTGVECVLREASRQLGDDTLFGLEYSPENFIDTEPDFALEVCERVMDTWEVGPGREIIINLPATVERYTPDAYADQVEWMSRNLSRREYVCLSVHNHNDRGSGVAAAELALKAGAQRVEGCLLGQGERTGNADLLTLALNLYSQGVDPCLRLSRLDEICRRVERATGMGVPPRHPYAGELVYTSFSGSHQDAINKGFAWRERAVCAAGGEENAVPWSVPYLPIDPRDVGRDYRAIVRVNSQSGKAGIAFSLRRDFQLDLPREMQTEFYRVVQREAELLGAEVDSTQLALLFAREYLPVAQHHLLFTLGGRSPGERTGSESLKLEAAANENRLLVQGGATERNTESSRRAARAYELHSFHFRHDAQADCICGSWQVRLPGHSQPLLLSGSGDGLISAFVTALVEAGIEVKILDYVQHALESGKDARAAAYVQVELEGKVAWGAGIDRSISRAGYEAIISALNRAKE